MANSKVWISLRWSGDNHRNTGAIGMQIILISYIMNVKMSIGQSNHKYVIKTNVSMSENNLS